MLTITLDQKEEEALREVLQALLEVPEALEQLKFELDKRWMICQN